MRSLVVPTFRNIRLQYPVAVRPRGLEVLFLAGLVAIFVGCGKPPDPSKTLKTISSWLATATFAGDAWVAHSTPNPFTRNTLRRARLEIATGQHTLFTDASLPVDTVVLASSLQRARNTLATMEQLIDRGQPEQFAAQLSLLKADADSVKAMSDRMNQGQ